MKSIFQLICVITLFIALTGFKDDFYSNLITLNTICDTLVQVRLEDNGKVFPKYVYKFNYINNLYIKNCLYEKIPEEINTFTDLETLQVINCYKLNYEDMLFKLRNNTKLKEIVLSNDSLKSIPKSIKYLTNLEKIYLNNNCLEELPNELFTLNKLVCIFLSDNNIKRLNVEGETNSTVIYMDLSSNNLKKIPDGLEKLKALKRLDLSYNPELSLEEICGLGEELQGITELYISNINKDSIEPLPKNINNLKKLDANVYIQFSQFTKEQVQYMLDQGINIFTNNMDLDVLYNRIQKK